MEIRVQPSSEGASQTLLCQYMALTAMCQPAELHIFFKSRPLIMHDELLHDLQINLSGQVRLYNLVLKSVLQKYRHFGPSIIPLSRVPSFFKKWQVVIKFLYLQNKDNFKFTLQPTVLTTLFHEYSVGLSFQGGQGTRKKNNYLIHQNFSINFFFVFPFSNP